VDFGGFSYWGGLGRLRVWIFGDDGAKVNCDGRA